MKIQELENAVQESLTEALAICKANCRDDNPIEVWTYCEGILDAAVRRRIAENLKQTGRNPYTGKIQ